MEQLYASQSPPVCNPTLCVAPHHVRVPSRRKYVFTDQIDRLIQESYHNRRDEKTRFQYPVAGQEGRYAALGAEEACPRIRLGTNQRAAMERGGASHSGPACVDERRTHPSEAEGWPVLPNRYRNPPQAETDAVQA